MKLAVLFFAVVCIGLKTCEAQRCRSKRDCDNIFTVTTKKPKPTPTKPIGNPFPDNNDSLREQLLVDAVRRTTAQLAILDKKSRPLKLSPMDAKLGQILKSNDRAREIGRAALTQLNFIRAFKELFDNRTRNTRENFTQALDRVFGGRILGVQRCGRSRQKRMALLCSFSCLVCNAALEKVRRFNGQCNNLGNPYYGSANIGQWRLLPADYSDGFFEFRKSVSPGNPDLPSARDVTQNLLPVGEATDQKASHFSMQVGQFLDHDITHTPVKTLSYGPVVPCGEDCVETFFCKPIKTGPNTCMNFVRSELFLKVTCPLAPIVPGNTITSWIDASQVYGSSDEEAAELIDFGTGYMKVTDNPLDPSLKPYLPHKIPSLCKTTAGECFLAGDVRQNEQSGLTAMHTVFVRLHNYIADQLKARKPGIAANNLFQLTRKILIGFWQHIVYNEYLPSILGAKIMRNFKLKPKRNRFFKGYDDSVKPDITVAFSTAAFRFGHTQIKKKMTFNNANQNAAQNYFLSRIQFNPQRLYNSGVNGVSGVDSVIQGLVGVADGARDNKFTDQVRNHLFTESPPNGPGFDLPALNIQRGRDHGLPSFVHWRKFLGVQDPLPSTFNQLTGMSVSTNNFANVYDHVEDIDLYAGGINEKKANDAQVGPTFGNIIAMQFKKLKFGDRFYYERNIGNQGFTAAQLAQVRRISLARILCDTLDAVNKIQPRALYLPNDSDNRRVSCNNNRIKDVDYSVFV